MSNRRTYRVAVLGGDGIGPEVVDVALEVVRAAGVAIATSHYELGAARYLRDGFVMDDATLEELRLFDAILLGAVGPAIGDSRIPAGVLERGLLLRLRFGACNQHVHRVCDRERQPRRVSGPHAGV